MSCVFWNTTQERKTETLIPWLVMTVQYFLIIICVMYYDVGYFVYSLVWSSEGCDSVTDADFVGRSVTCRCNHLTTFAVVAVSLPTTYLPTTVEIFNSSLCYFCCCWDIEHRSSGLSCWFHSEF